MHMLIHRQEIMGIRMVSTALVKGPVKEKYRPLRRLNARDTQSSLSSHFNFK